MILLRFKQLLLTLVTVWCDYLITLIFKFKFKRYQLSTLELVILFVC